MTCFQSQSVNEREAVMASHPVANSSLHLAGDDVIGAATQTTSTGPGQIPLWERVRVVVGVPVILTERVVAEQQQLSLSPVGSFQQRLDEYLKSKHHTHDIEMLKP